MTSMRIQRSSSCLALLFLVFLSLVTLSQGEEAQIVTVACLDVDSDFATESFCTDFELPEKLCVAYVDATAYPIVRKVNEEDDDIQLFVNPNFLSFQNYEQITFNSTNGRGTLESPFASQLCPLDPVSVPVVRSEKEYCHAMSCRSDLDCNGKYMVIGLNDKEEYFYHQPRQCFKYCVHCTQDRNLCKQQAEINGNVIRSVPCSSGLWDWHFLPRTLSVGFMVVISTLSALYFVYLAVLVRKRQIYTRVQQDELLNDDSSFTLEDGDELDFSSMGDSGN